MMRSTLPSLLASGYYAKVGQESPTRGYAGTAMPRGWGEFLKRRNSSERIQSGKIRFVFFMKRLKRPGRKPRVNLLTHRSDCSILSLGCNVVSSSSICYYVVLNNSDRFWFSNTAAFVLELRNSHNHLLSGHCIANEISMNRRKMKRNLFAGVIFYFVIESLLKQY